MPILDIQQRFRELGRIRTGQQVPTGNGKRMRPEKLARFRLTSEWPHLIEQAAEVYGGTARPWDNAGHAEYEVIVEADSLPVVIPPGEVLDQWYELWSGGGCQRRCDGLRQVLTDKACQCPADPMERQDLAGRGQACKPTTRLRLMLPEVADVGIWRLESHGFHAAAELGGSVGLVEAATRSGAMIPADLRLASREGARRPGTPKKTFFVPAISFRGTLGPVLDALGILETGATMPRILGVEGRPSLEAGGRAALPAGGSSFDPVPVEPAGFGTAPTPAPGPSGPADEPDVGETPVAAPGAFAPPTEPTGFAPPPEVPPPAPQAFDPPAPEAAGDDGEQGGDGPVLSGPQVIAIRFGDRGVKDRGHRLRIVSWLLNREVTSGNDLRPAEVRSVLEVLNDDDAWTSTLGSVPPDAEEEAPSAPVAPSEPDPAPEPPREVLVPEVVSHPPATRRRAAASNPEAMDGDQWRTFLTSRKVKVTELIREAGRLAREGDTTAPTTLDEISSSGLAPDLIGFVEALAADRGQA